MMERILRTEYPVGAQYDGRHWNLGAAECAEVDLSSFCISGFLLFNVLTDRFQILDYVEHILFVSILLCFQNSMQSKQNEIDCLREALKRTRDELDQQKRLNKSLSQKKVSNAENGSGAL